MTDSEEVAEAAPQARPKRFVLLKRALLVGIVLGASALLYNSFAEWMVTRWDATAPRNAQGILIGAEELDLGPEDASTAVLLVHGFVGGSNNFWELPQRLADAGFRVRAMRLPGHGTSAIEFAQTPPGDFPVAVLKELRSLKASYSKVILVGHSMGGALSTLGAAMEEVDGLVLGAPYYGISYQWYYMLPAEFWATVTAPVVKWMYRTDQFTRVNRAEARREILAYRWIPSAGTQTLIHIGRRARDPFVLEQILCPVLMLHSPNDFAASPAEAERAFDLLGSEEKRLVWLEKSDHQIFWDYDRDEVIEEILTFVEKVRS